MAQDFTSFGHGNTVFREKIRHCLLHDDAKPLPPGVKPAFAVGETVV
jgi:hypothetical protein